MSEESDWDELEDELEGEAGLRNIINSWENLPPDIKLILFMGIMFEAICHPDWKKIVSYWQN